MLVSAMVWGVGVRDWHKYRVCLRARCRLQLSGKSLALIARITELERQLHSQTTEFTASTDEPQTALSSAAPISTDVPEPAIPLPETFNTSKKRPH
jgi:hypothetical protein